MATTAISGHNGSVTGLGTVEVREWSAELEYDLADATSMASAGFKEYVTNLQGGTFRLTIYSKAMPTVQTYTSGIGAALTLALISGGSGAMKVSGSGFVERVSPAVPVDGILKYEVRGRFTGAITVATVT